MNPRCMLFLVFSLSGCSGGSPTPTPPTPPTKNESTSIPSNPEPIPAPTVEPPRAPSEVQEGAGVTTTSKAKPTVPLHLAEIVNRVDLRKIQPMAGMTLNSATIDQWVCSLPNSSGKSSVQVLDYLESRLLESGCTRSPQSDLESNDTKSPSRVYQHGDLLIETGASQVERFNAPPETLAYIRMLGNLDLRTLSWFEGMEVQRSGLVSMQLSRQGGILEWRKLFSERFKQSGWQEYRSFLPGIDIPVEDQVPSQSFLLNGLTIRLTYRDDRGELIKDQDAKGVMNCLMSVSLVPYEPILPGQVTSLEVRWSPVAIVYETTLSLDQLHEQLDRLYKSEGYEVTRKQSPESADTTQLVCMHADLLDLVIEFKKSGKKTLVVINETRS